MRYLVPLTVFAFTVFIISTIARYSVEIEELKERKVKVDNTRSYTPEERTQIKTDHKTKALPIKEKPSLTESARTHINSKKKSPLPFSNNVNEENLFKPQEIIYENNQEEVNVVLEDYKENETILAQDKYSPDKQAIEDYKRKALVRLFSSKKQKDEAVLSEPDFTLPELSNAEEIIDLKDIPEVEELEPQTPSETVIENPYQDFNFSKEESIEIDLNPSTTNGKVLPNIRLTLENSKGQIILEGSTDLQGNFKKNITKFTGEKIYVRYYGVGISQEKIEIVKQGEE